MKLGKRQIKIICLVGIATALMYYMNNLIQVGQTFSDGILIGFMMGLIAVCSLGAIYLWLEMLWLNWKVRQK